MLQLATLIQKLWPTPTINGNDNFKGASATSGDGLHTAIRKREGTWPTPTRHDCNGHCPSELLRRSPNLSAIASYPTLRVSSLCGGTCAWNAIQGNPALTTDEKRAMTSTHGQLNPDWVEWLMGWPVGWTDPECDRPWPFLPLGADPADLPPTMPGYVPRTTMRRKHRPTRIRSLGNGQVPKCASAAFRIGLELLGEPER